MNKYSVSIMCDYGKRNIPFDDFEKAKAVFNQFRDTKGVVLELLLHDYFYNGRIRSSVVLSAYN